MLRVWLAIACLLGAATNAAATGRAIIVLDSSRSMWGQIAGVSKMEIARESLDEVLGSVAADVELGLVVYGHRREADCADIELLVPPALAAGRDIVARARRVTPKGKTPLSGAVAHAAEVLKYAEEPATVILVTDGLETCRRDPCALAAQLAKTGVDFTVHVVGFGLSDEEGRQVACMAENTGGMYLEASDAEQLGAALERMVAATAKTGDALNDTPLPGPPAAALQEASHRRIPAAQEASTGPTAAAAPKKAPTRPPGAAARRAPRPVASLTAASTVEAGRLIVVGWQGPGGRDDHVEIYDPSAVDGQGKVLRGKRLRNDDFQNRRASIPAPATAGTYQLRYWSAADGGVLAEQAIEVVAVNVALSAKDVVEAGGPFQVGWAGPEGRYDTVQLFDPQGNDGEGKVVREQRLRGSGFANRRVTLRAPATAGRYELRYWNGDNRKVLAARPIVVALAKAEPVAP